MLVLGGVVQKVDIRSAIGMEVEEGRKRTRRSVDSIVRNGQSLIEAIGAMGVGVSLRHDLLKVSEDPGGKTNG